MAAKFNEGPFLFGTETRTDFVCSLLHCSQEVNPHITSHGDIAEAGQVK